MYLQNIIIVVDNIHVDCIVSMLRMIVKKRTDYYITFDLEQVFYF